MIYRETVLQNNPIFYLPLNERNSEFIEIVNDSSITASSINYFSRIPGTYFFGAEFDGLTNSIDLGINNSLNDFSVEFWLFTRSSSSSDPHLVSHALKNSIADTDQPFSIRINEEGTVITANFSDGSTSSYSLSLTANLTNSVNHITVTRNGITGDCVLYVNGEITDSGVLASALSVYSGNWILGSINGHNSTYASCIISEFVLYDAVIPHSVITTHYQMGLVTLPAPRYNDPVFNLTELLIHGTGSVTRGSADLSSTTTSSTVKIFDTSIRTSSPITSAQSIMSNDFTLEAWVNFDNNSLSKIFSSGSKYLALENNRAVFVVESTITSRSVISVNRWYHVAVCRQAGTTRLFINGINEGEIADSAPHDFTNLEIGDYLGHIDEIRITKFARYSSNFEVPDLPFPDYQLHHHKFNSYDQDFDRVANLLHGDTFTDVSKYRHAVTVTGTVTIEDGPFNGTKAFQISNNNYLTAVTIPLISHDKTIEFWVNPTQAADCIIFDNRPSEGNYIMIGLNAQMQPRIKYNNEHYTSRYSIPLNEWTHIAFSIKNHNGILFINGVPTRYLTITNFVSSTSIKIGHPLASMTGRISEIRVIEGVSRYFSTFELQNTRFRDVTNYRWTSFAPPQAIDPSNIEIEVNSLIVGQPVIDPLDIQIVIGLNKISGQAIRADGQAAEFVSIHSEDGAQLFVKTPNLDGGYQFNDLDASKKYFIVVSSDNMQPNVFGPVYPDAQ